MTVEEQGYKIFEDYFRNNLSFKGMSHEFITNRDLQYRGMDYFIYKDGKVVSTVEVKAEAEEKYGNFAIEQWSNYSIRRHGWAVTSEARMLFYIFLSPLQMYKMPMYNVVWDSITRFSDLISPSAQGMKPQTKIIQKNDTWNYTPKINPYLAHVGGQKILG